eukprot:363395-Chlamydomonas_euryale.AAC.7
MASIAAPARPPDPPNCSVHMQYDVRRRMMYLEVTALPPHRPAAPQDPTSGKSIDAEGAGRSWQSPGWLTQLGMLWGGKGVSCRAAMHAVGRKGGELPGGRACCGAERV